MPCHPDSPNGCFARHGYLVVKAPNARGELKKRMIYSDAGDLVLEAAGYDAEIAFCRTRGLITVRPLEEAQIGHPRRPGTAGT